MSGQAPPWIEASEWLLMRRLLDFGARDADRAVPRAALAVLYKPLELASVLGSLHDRRLIDARGDRWWATACGADTSLAVRADDSCWVERIAARRATMAADVAVALDAGLEAGWWTPWMSTPEVLVDPETGFVGRVATFSTQLELCRGGFDLTYIHTKSLRTPDAWRVLASALVVGDAHATLARWVAEVFSR
jgi:hypothetical protein